MEQLILIKYGELTTKKQNRNLFIKQLYENIRLALNEYTVKIQKDRVRMFIKCNEEDSKSIINLLSNIFGIHSIVICHQVNNNIEDIQNKILNLYKNYKFNSFKIETKRSNKSFELNSMEVNNHLGDFILRNFNGSIVDIHNPKTTIKLEIRNEATYIYSEEIKGLGGYPVGVQGKGLVMLSGGIDSPVALYLALKRGIKVECIYFESPPHTSIQAQNKVKKLIKILNKYQPSIKIHIVKFTSIQESIYQNMDSTYMITILRRMMYRISEIVAKKNKCHVIINGESIGQVASQTLTSIKVINEVTNYPIIRPLCSFDKLEIIEISKKIGTYETSILPYEDCCTIFVPKHPVINPNIKKCIDEENKIDYQLLINEAINNIATEKINNN